VQYSSEELHVARLYITSKAGWAFVLLHSKRGRGGRLYARLQWYATGYQH